MNVRVLRETSVLGQRLTGEKGRRRTIVKIVIGGEDENGVRSECDVYVVGSEIGSERRMLRGPYL